MTKNNPIRVLLVDDDEDDYLIIKKIVDLIPRAPFQLDWTDSYDEAVDAIRNNSHELYLVDYRLGPQSGLDLLGNFDLALKEQPFVILTGAGDNKIERRAMEMGVADYLVKGRFDTQLLSRVMYYSLQRKSMELQRVHQLMEINRSKDEFITLASHQLRTPATAVKQYIGMLLEGYAGDMTEAQLDFLQKAHDSNERQMRIVNDILKVARLDLNKTELNYKPTKTASLLSGIINDLKPEFDKRHQIIKVEIADKKSAIIADATYLGMAISNIIDNASKYTPDGKSIEIIQTDSTDECQIRIIDEGVGIATEDIERLFIKFSRIPNPLSVVVSGTGLGLYWSHQIISLHGGSIHVTSEPNVGTTFTITIPRAISIAK